MELRRIKKMYAPSLVSKEEVEEILIMRKGHTNKLDKLKSVFHELDLDKIQEVWAVHGQLSSTMLAMHMAFIEEWKVIKLYLWSNKRPNIIQQIQEINFPQLKELHIGWNNIETIDSLSSIRMPQLKQLVVRDNHITSIKPLKFCNFPKLRVLVLRGNYIHNFCFGDLNYQNLRELNLNDNTFVNLAQLTKINSQRPQIIRGSSYLLISECDSSLNALPAELVVQIKLRFPNSKIVQV